MGEWREWRVRVRYLEGRENHPYIEERLEEAIKLVVRAMRLTCRVSYEAKQITEREVN